MQLESSRPVAVRTLAHFARRNLADKLRKQGAGQAVTVLLGGWDEVRIGEKRVWWYVYMYVRIYVYLCMYMYRRRRAARFVSGVGGASLALCRCTSK